MFYLFYHVGCIFPMKMSIVCKKCSCRAILHEMLLESGYGGFCCFPGHLKEGVPH